MTVMIAPPQQGSTEPNGLVIFALGFCLMLTFITLVWGVPALIERIREQRHQPRRPRPARVPVMPTVPSAAAPIMPPMDRPARPPAAPPTTPALTGPPAVPATTPPAAQPMTAAGVAWFASLAFARVLGLSPKAVQSAMIVATPGGGKTTLINTWLVEDVANAANQVLVLNPHFTAYHPEDQPIDLRPLGDHIEVHWSYPAIRDALRNLVAEIEQVRQPRYRAGEAVGHTIVVYIDELPSIADSDVGEECAELLRKLLREARKYKIYLKVATQDALTATLKLSSGARRAFVTRVIGTTDPDTWRALAGGAPYRQFGRGEFFVCGPLLGVTRVQAATPERIAQVARQLRPKYLPIVPATKEQQPVVTPASPELLTDLLSRPVTEPADTGLAASAAVEQPVPLVPLLHADPRELEAMRQWLTETDAQGRPLSGRELARRLYRLRKGVNAETYDGSGPTYTEAKALATLVRNNEEQPTTGQSLRNAQAA